MLYGGGKAMFYRGGQKRAGGLWSISLQIKTLTGGHRISHRNTLLKIYHIYLFFMPNEIKVMIKHFLKKNANSL